MTDADRELPDGPPAAGGWVTAGAGLLLLAAASHIVLGAAAIAGNGTLEDHVSQIESNPNFGRLYLGLGTWGAILLLIGLAQVGAVRSLVRRSEHARVFGLSTAILGLGAAFFTLAIFRFAALVSVGLLLCALYVLSYRVDDPPPRADGAP